MKNKERLYPIILVLTALFLIFSSSTALAANSSNVLAFQGNYNDAIKAFDKAIEIDPQNEDAWINKGPCLIYLGSYEDAIIAFDKAIEINSQEFDAWYSKGLCLMNLGKYKEAVEALDKAIEIYPQHNYALSLKESILSNSNGLTISLKSLFSDNSIFVEEDDLLEYAQTYLKTFGGCINDSNLTQEERCISLLFKVIHIQ